MPQYSHSRISTFEQCKLKFKYQYIDRVETEVENTIEAFLGSMVHETLEKLYKDLKFQKLNTLPELLAFYKEHWDKHYTSGILVVREGYTPENYKAMGEKYLTDYYGRFAPFDQEITILLEGYIEIQAGSYVLRGYIDRLSCDKKGNYFIHDYKTGNHLPTQEDVDLDRQLALYAIAVRQNYKDCRTVTLLWHYLAFDKTLKSSRTEEQLERLKQEVAQIIERIESTHEFPPQKSALCDWCEYRSMCPEWKHLYKIEGKGLNKYIEDDGAVLANKYAKIKKEADEWQRELEEVKEALVAFAKKEGITQVFGDEVAVTVRSYPRLSFPKKEEPLLQQKFFDMLKKTGLWEKLAVADVYELAKKINNGEVHPDIVKLLEPFIQRGETVYVRVNKR